VFSFWKEKEEFVKAILIILNFRRLLCK